MKLVYASHTETVVGDKKSITPEKLDKMLLAIATIQLERGVANESIKGK